MDTRHHRPSGSENARPALHQRHKSTGNLANMSSSSSTAGIRGLAKRAAFDDVTNMVKHATGARDEAKIHKAQSAWHLNTARPKTALGKENPPPGGKEEMPLSRPARKLPALANKPSNVGGRSTDTEKGAGKPSWLVYSEAQKDEPQNYLPEGSKASAATLAAPPLQPRHHKSQPQLKQQQPTLRRTQSRQLERARTHNETASCPERNVQSISARAAPQHSGQPDAADVADARPYVPIVDEVIYEESQREESENLPEISEEPATVAVPVNFGEDPTPAMSEPEEYWDGDEEYYDDQGYTTAHSIPSRDMTTGGVTTVLQPKVTMRVQRELEEARLEVEATLSQDDIEDELWDITVVAEYNDDIFDYLRELEAKMLPNPHYMELQTEIQWSMRAVLMEWLVQVHARFALLPETLFLTVNYVDRFLSAKVVSIGKLQLVGATAILVASKYEEINCPSLQEIIYMVDGGYSADEILKAERFMLSMLGFELGWPGPMSFLRRVSKADDYDLETRTLAKYFLELTIMDERFVASPPSFLAAGAHCLSRLILNKGHWTKHHVHYSGYTWNQLKSLVSMLLECCENPMDHHQAIYEKYAEKRFKEASLMVQAALDSGFTLPHQSRPVRIETYQSQHLAVQA